VAEAEKRVLSNPNYNHEYPPIGGLPELALLSQKLAFGENAKDLETIATLQSLSGTGSLRVLGGFFARHWKDTSNLPTMYLPQPTWGNHVAIFNHAGLKTEYYSYYDPATCGLNIQGMLKDLKNAPENSIILLHATAHNPTGVDPKPEQWREICNVIKKKGNMVLFDMAYQGFASGDCDRDAYSVRLFREQGVQFTLAQSFAKNFGLYGHRVGAVSVIGQDVEEKKRIESQLKIVARGIYSNPPVHGARIVAEILKDPQLKKKWLGDVKTMAERIISMRKLLKDGLAKAGSKRNWNHITEQIGMFCYSGMTPEQVDRLTSQYHIYMTRNGRISMAGVTTSNVQILATAIHEVTK
jgi:aspartate aminotransferase